MTRDASTSGNMKREMRKQRKSRKENRKMDTYGDAPVKEIDGPTEDVDNGADIDLDRVVV